MENKINKRISIWKLFIFVIYVCVFSIIGFSLPKTINLINGLSETALYGQFASYAVAIILAWLFLYNYSFLIKRRSYFDIIFSFIKEINLSLIKRRKLRRKRYEKWIKKQ